jgi:hypothetical protein
MINRRLMPADLLTTYRILFFMFDLFNINLFEILDLLGAFLVIGQHQSQTISTKQIKQALEKLNEVIRACNHKALWDHNYDKAGFNDNLAKINSAIDLHNYCNAAGGTGKAISTLDDLVLGGVATIDQINSLGTAVTKLKDNTAFLQNRFSVSMNL